MLKVRHAFPGEQRDIAEQAWQYIDVVPPYILSDWSVKGYLDRWLIVYDDDQEDKPIVGSCHYAPMDVGDKELERNLAYLDHVRQVPGILKRRALDDKAIVLGQFACPGKGSLKAIIDYLKKQNTNIYSWLSINSPLITYYEQKLDFCFHPYPEKFMNVSKGDYSKFKWGYWNKFGKQLKTKELWDEMVKKDESKGVYIS